MRWDNLTLSAGSDQGALFGAEEVVERTFDTPEFRGMTFYEVRARSIVNKVPGASRVPFQWTINPYRGCSHQCVYCLEGDTPILMADGRTKRLIDVRVGDSIYGTVREGAYRRYVITEVLAHWATVKPAYRVTLEDGTELVASADHRFLTGRGWKHVTGRMNRAGLRPYLTTDNELLGTGRFAASPGDSPEYRRGYLCGMVRGDAHPSTYHYPSARGKASCRYRFRLAPADLEALGDAANPFSILTKGTLVLRDLDLLRRAAAVTDVAVNVSVGFVDERLWRRVEAGTPTPRARLGVCRSLTEAGIGCGVLMAPILPYLTDSDEQLDATVRAIAEAGANSVSPIVLHLRPGAREWYLSWLRRDYPELLPRYEELYARGAYAPKSYQRDVAARVARLARHYGVGSPTD